VLVVMKRDATKEEIDGVVRRIGELGLTATPLPGAERTAIGPSGRPGPWWMFRTAIDRS